MGPARGGDRAVSVVALVGSRRSRAIVLRPATTIPEAIMAVHLQNALILLAEGANGGGGGAAGQQQGGSLWAMLLPMLAIGFLFYFLLIRPQRQEQTRRQTMLSAVKKNDRVITIGGVYGVVTNVHREADEVTIKVDETTNTKLRVTLSSIARILGDEPAGEAPSK
jgi:preprotein translocase subunit YajC